MMLDVICYPVYLTPHAALEKDIAFTAGASYTPPMTCNLFGNTDADATIAHSNK